jgi:hypothetical protein
MVGFEKDGLARRPFSRVALQAAGKDWSQLSDLNRRPTVYKTVALPLS